MNALGIPRIPGTPCFTYLSGLDYRARFDYEYPDSDAATGRPQFPELP